MAIIKTFTLSAHKKCIAQSNFDPYLHSIKLDPGEYTIKYVSGAILSNGYKYYNQYLSDDNKNDGKYNYWNRYYESNEISLGDYDISYFPDNVIKLCCFQCQFGTLPGFTSTGYKTKIVADTFNSTMLNNISNTFVFTDELKFTIDNPLTLIFWYTDLYEQSVYGEITYQIEAKTSVSDYYLNDISVMITDTNNKLKSFENHSNKIITKSSFTENLQIQEVWINKLASNSYVKDITDFNTIGYNELSGMLPIDTINFDKLYSSDFYWELIQYFNAPIELIGKYDCNSSDLLLYEGTYTLIPADDNMLASKIIEYTDETYIKIPNINALKEYSFSISENFKILNFDFLNTGYKNSIYLYYGNITQENLIYYFNNNNKSYQEFNVNVDNYLDYIMPEIKKEYELNNLNEYAYEYYLNVKNIEDGYILISQSDHIENEFEIGPFDTLKTAYDIAYKYIINYFQIFNARCYIKTLTNGINASYIVILNNGPEITKTILNN